LVFDTRFNSGYDKLQVAYRGGEVQLRPRGYAAVGSGYLQSTGETNRSAFDEQGARLAHRDGSGSMEVSAYDANSRQLSSAYYWCVGRKVHTHYWIVQSGPASTSMFEGMG
jgi:hypothetical protein